jgi:hypothetical protein
MPAPSLEALKRAIDLADYARSVGYVERPRDSIPGIVVLERARSGERIAVARLAEGGIYARISNYALRAPAEPDESARSRLRECIIRSSDTGSIVEFVRSRARMARQPEPDLERVREHLAAWQELARSLGPALESKDLSQRIGEGRTRAESARQSTASEVEERLARWHEAQRAIDRKLAHVSNAHSIHTERAMNVPGPDRSARPEAGVRRYDWSPAPSGRATADQYGQARREGRSRDEGRGR